MRLINKFVLVAVLVAGVALLVEFFGNKNQLDAVGSTPLKETPEYAAMVANAEKLPDLKIFPGTFANALESKQQMLGYKMTLAEDRSFLFSVSSYAARKDWATTKPSVSKQLSGVYRIKGNVIYFENLQGDTGLMSDKARSVIGAWTQEGIEFKSENSVMRLRMFAPPTANKQQ